MKRPPSAPPASFLSASSIGRLQTPVVNGGLCRGGISAQWLPPIPHPLAGEGVSEADGWGGE
jgi:hypothetical protein